MTKEKQFTSFDTEGPTDFDHVGFHLDTVEDLLQLINTCYNMFPFDIEDQKLITNEKLDELRHYTDKLKRYVGQGPYHVYHSQPLPKGGIDIENVSYEELEVLEKCYDKVKLLKNQEDLRKDLRKVIKSLHHKHMNNVMLKIKQYPV